jgi:6-pyruvoyltetrahydropterin/6-carboxytetrahydropterin synthase
MHAIEKLFNFAYGHRVWSQTLDSVYSIDSCLACRHLHGHEGQIAVGLKHSGLKGGMVTDFKHLNWFKEFVDDVVDHKFIIDINDPAFNRITGKNPSHVKYRQTVVDSASSSIGYLPLIASMTEEFTEDDEVSNEITESFVIVNFVPTSENLSKWFFNIVKEKMAKFELEIAYIKFNETPKSMAVYYD